MAQFLNTDGLREWIPRLIDESERELVIVVPYIRTSDLMHQSLLEADERGVETTIVYREESLIPDEKSKLLGISNLNLLHHPNIHAKCYLNEQSLIITSMNMYEFSEKNNREMGILCQRGGWDSHHELFEDTVIEIRQIINGSQMEKQSRETIEEGFEVEIIKTSKEKQEDFCKLLNKVFVFKSFQVADVNGNWVSRCTNYFDKIDLTFTHRAEIDLMMPSEIVKKMFYKSKPQHHEYYFDGYKFYWNHWKGTITLYANRQFDQWEGIDDEAYYKLYKEGIDEVIQYLRRLIK